MKLFTVILELQGGTYISQIKSFSEKNVIEDWISGASKDEIPALNHPEFYNKLKQELSDDIHEPILLDGLYNAYCISGAVENNFFLFTIVETVVGQNSQ